MNKIISCMGLKRIFDLRSITTKTRITPEGKDVPKKKNFENRITLIGTDDSVSIINLKNAQNLSVKKELKLVKIQDVDAKTRRPVYKLMTNTEYHAEELETRKLKKEHHSGQPKAVKLISLSWRIGDHDLHTSIKKMIKLVEKRHEVRVTITCDNEHEIKDLEKIYSVIEKEVKSVANILQKRFKGNHLKFQLVQLKTEKSSTNSNSGENKEGDKGPI